MAYNNGFPAGYPYMMPAQPGAYQSQTPVTNTQPVQNNMIWVSGEAGAKAYLVAPNTTVQLWDSEAQTIYLKSADGSGMPTMKVLDYTIREAQAPNTPTLMQDNLPEYVTKHEFEEFVERVNKTLQKRKREREREVEDDE